MPPPINLNKRRQKKGENMQDSNQLRLLKTVLSYNSDSGDVESVRQNIEDAIKEVPDAIFSTDDKLLLIFKSAKSYFTEYHQVLNRCSYKLVLDNLLARRNITDEEHARRLMAFDDVGKAMVQSSEYALLKKTLLDELKKKNTRTKIAESIRGLDMKLDGMTENQVYELFTHLTESLRPSSSASLLKFVSTEQLKTMDLPPIKHIIEDLLPAEGLTILAAQKKAGKSAFAMQLASSIARGQNFLGKKTQQGKVLYYAMEQSNSLNKERLRKQNLGFSNNFLLVDDKDKKNLLKLDQAGIEQLREVITSQSPSLVIIDTWQRLAPETYNRKDAYQNAVKDLSPLQELAQEKHCAILILTHTRKVLKQSEDPFDDVMGSSGLTGTADCVIMLCRPRNQSEAILHLTSRVSKELKWSVKFDADYLLWSYEGEYSEVRKGIITSSIVKIFRQEGKGTELTIEDITDHLQVDTELKVGDGSSVRMALGRLVKDHTLIKVGRGKYTLSEIDVEKETELEELEELEAI